MCTENLPKMCLQLRLRLAVHKGYVDTVNKIITNNPELLCKKNPQTPPLLHIAVMSGNLEMVKLLIERGADVNEWHSNGGINETCLLLLADSDQNDSLEIARVLIKHGADVNAVSNCIGMSVLNYALSNGNARFVELLLRCGARVDKLVPGVTLPPLLVAASSWNARELVPLMLKYGADVNVQKWGMSALHALCRNNSADKSTAKILLESGASALKRDEFGCSALRYAYDNKCAGLSGTLMRYGDKELNLDNSRKSSLRSWPGSKTRDPCEQKSHHRRRRKKTQTDGDGYPVREKSCQTQINKRDRNRQQQTDANCITVDRTNSDPVTITIVI